MDILAGLKDKLRFIEKFYDTASEPFRETKRKIEAGESPFEPLHLDPETAPDEPDYLEEWSAADDSLNLVGQTALSLGQLSFKEYLDGFVFLNPPPRDYKARGENWFERRKDLFANVYHIEWEKGPVAMRDLEEINLTRNDIHHREIPYGSFGLTAKQSEKHRTRFPLGLFVHEIDRQMEAHSSGGSMGRIYVTKENLAEVIRRVETFCEYLSAQRNCLR